MYIYLFIYKIQCTDVTQIALLSQTLQEEPRLGKRDRSTIFYLSRPFSFTASTTLRASTRVYFRISVGLLINNPFAPNIYTSAVHPRDRVNRARDVETSNEIRAQARTRTARSTQFSQSFDPTFSFSFPPLRESRLSPLKTRHGRPRAHKIREFKAPPLASLDSVARLLRRISHVAVFLSPAIMRKFHTLRLAARGPRSFTTASSSFILASPVAAGAA